MHEIAQSISDIVADYHKENSDDMVIMTANRIITWVNQFDSGDREFILSEFLYLLEKGIYISKSRAIELLWKFVNFKSDQYKYSTLEEFLRESFFISVQSEGKSQNTLINLLNNEVRLKFGFEVNSVNLLGVRHFIYIDDILATGGTFRKEIHDFINNKCLLPRLVSKDATLDCYFFCAHSWNCSNTRYALKMMNNNSYFTNVHELKISCHYLIENNISNYNERLNLVYPEKSLKDFDVYLDSLTIPHRNFEKAYRPPNLPNSELFYRSIESRKRLEKIFLSKGIDIISKIKDENKRQNHRPLGMTIPSNKTFGTGTLFFTWRNISNTCPIVIWWDVPSHDWKGLFPIKNRGNLKSSV